MKEHIQIDMYCWKHKNWQKTQQFERANSDGLVIHENLHNLVAQGNAN